MVRKDGESNRELAARLDDMASKWLKDCTSIEQMKDLVVMEQLIDMLPFDVRVFVRERKPHQVQKQLS